jgi:hypothetical protein
MKFHIHGQSNPELKLLVFTPENLEEAKMYPGASQAMAFWNDAPDPDTLVRFLNICLSKINHHKE